jgi:hypothetical protein
MLYISVCTVNWLHIREFHVRSVPFLRICWPHIGNQHKIAYRIRDPSRAYEKCNKPANDLNNLFCKFFRPIKHFTLSYEPIDLETIR